MLHLRRVLEAAVDHGAQQLRLEQKIPEARRVDARVGAAPAEEIKRQARPSSRRATCFPGQEERQQEEDIAGRPRAVLSAAVLLVADEGHVAERLALALRSQPPRRSVVVTRGESRHRDVRA